MKNHHEIYNDHVFYLKISQNQIPIWWKGFKLVPAEMKLQFYYGSSTKTHLSGQNYKGDYDQQINFQSHNGFRSYNFVCLLTSIQIFGHFRETSNQISHLSNFLAHYFKNYIFCPMTHYLTERQICEYAGIIACVPTSIFPRKNIHPC